MVNILSHRGYRKDGITENTIQAFDKAIELGADGFEFDIHLTADNVPICYHDNTLDKLGVSKSLKELTKEEIISIGLKNNIKIPTLDDILRKYGNKAFLNIEIKAADAALVVFQKLKDYDVSLEKNNIVISSFLEQPLKEIKKLDSSIPTGLLFVTPWRKLKKAKKLQCDALHPYYDKPPVFWQIPLVKILNRKIIIQGMKNNFMINPWTVNDPEYIRELLIKKATGIITDNLITALQIREELKKIK